MNELAFDLENRHPTRPVADFTLTVFGHAEPAGSKRNVSWQAKDGRTGQNLIEANPKAGGWKRLIAREAGPLWMGKPLILGPIEVHFTFYIPRPKSHYGARGNLLPSSPSRPSRPSRKPDCGKLSRGVEDALTGIIYRDDGQIVTEHHEKYWGTPERVEISIWKVR